MDEEVKGGKEGEEKKEGDNAPMSPRRETSELQNMSRHESLYVLQPLEDRITNGDEG